MNTKRVNAAAGVVAAAMTNGRRVPAAIAVALESAQMLMSPEQAAEMDRLRKRVAELEAQIAALTAQGQVLRQAPQTVVVENTHPPRVYHRYATAHDMPDRLCPQVGPHGAHVAEAGLSSEWLCHGVPHQVEAGGAL